MESWGSALYGDPCRQCGYDWSILPAEAVTLVVSTPARYAALLTGVDGSQRHPELGWSAGGYVCHVGDNLRIWAERLAGAALGGGRQVPGYDENLLAQARAYDQVPLTGALWSLRHAARDWQQAVDLALGQDLVLVHAGRGEQTAADVARNNAHDAYHHEWDIARVLDVVTGARERARVGKVLNPPPRQPLEDADAPGWPPRTPAAAGALMWDQTGRLLLLRPTYKPTWTVPGGCVEDGESPLAACLRELAEETGLVRDTGRLCCVDYRHPGPGAGGLRFLFELGPLTPGEEGAVQLPAEEIAEHRLVTATEALRLVDEAQARRLAAVLAGGSSVLYLEDGLPPPGSGSRRPALDGSRRPPPASP